MKDEPGNITLNIPDNFNLQGAKLETITQALAYRGIVNRHNLPPRIATTNNLEKIRTALEEYQDTQETDKTIWKSIGKCTIHLRAQQFFFKVIHNTPMVGGVWANIPGYKGRGDCNRCNTQESMEHILTVCEVSPAKLVWDLAKDMWPHNLDKWPGISLGIILGSGCLVTKEDAQEGNDNRDNSKKKSSMDRLLQILISEATHLIWVLRCKRVIQEQTHSPQEVKVRWLKVINRHLTDDKIIVLQIKRSKPFTQLVEVTWEGLLRKYSDLPYKWILICEVLVGSRLDLAWPTEGLEI